MAFEDRIWTWGVWSRKTLIPLMDGADFIVWLKGFSRWEFGLAFTTSLIKEEESTIAADG